MSQQEDILIGSPIFCIFLAAFLVAGKCMWLSLLYYVWIVHQKNLKMFHLHECAIKLPDIDANP